MTQPQNRRLLVLLLHELRLVADTFWQRSDWRQHPQASRKPPGIDSRCRELELRQGLDALRSNFAVKTLRAFCVTSGNAPATDGAAAAAITLGNSGNGPTVSSHAIDSM